MKEKGISIITAGMAKAMLETYQVEHFNNVVKNEVRRGFNGTTIYGSGQTELYNWVIDNREFITEQGYNLDISKANGIIHMNW